MTKTSRNRWVIRDYPGERFYCLLGTRYVVARRYHEGPHSLAWRAYEERTANSEERTLGHFPSLRAAQRAIESEIIERRMAARGRAVADQLRVEQGAHLRLIFREPAGLRQVEALITWTEQRPEGTYFGYQPFDCVNECAWGCAMLRPEPAPFGLQSVEVM